MSILAWIVLGLIVVAGATWLTPWSVLVSAGGAVIFLVVYHALQGTPSRPTV